MKFIREIARGGFGSVQEVELADKSRVARKTFDPDSRLVSTPEALKKLKIRFKREVRTQGLLSTDFFIPVLLSSLDANPASFTMPLAEKNYSEQIKADRLAGTPDSGPLADILNSLEELHRLDYRHRDLKPQNILFHDGRWRLADFGLVLPPSPDTTLVTSSHEWFGTTRYMAPEQLTNFHTVSPAADIFAFGCILHDLVGTSPRTPFQQCSASGVLGHVIDKCTYFDPFRRFQNVATLRAALLHALSKGVKTAPDASTVEWETELKDLSSWDTAKMRGLLTYFENRTEWGLLQELDEERLEKLSKIDGETWNEIALIYCGWAGDFGFDYEYCDVIIGRLEKIYEIGSASLKTAAAVAAAKLGANHNRWYVMRRLLNICGPSMNATVAERLSIEIIAEQAEDKFRKCVERINRSIESYHPLIREVLTEEPTAGQEPEVPNQPNS